MSADVPVVATAPAVGSGAANGPFNIGILQKAQAVVAESNARTIEVNKQVEALKRIADEANE